MIMPASMAWSRAFQTLHCLPKFWYTSQVPKRRNHTDNHQVSPLTSKYVVDGQGTTWLMCVVWSFMYGRPEAIEIRFRSVDDKDATKGLYDMAHPQPTGKYSVRHNRQSPFPITAARFRKLMIGKHLAVMRREFAESHAITAQWRRDAGEDAAAGESDDLASRWGAPQQGIRLSDEHLEKVAEAYRVALRDGEGIYEALRDEFGISTSTASKRVMAARRKGLLRPALQSRAGEAESEEST